LEGAQANLRAKGGDEMTKAKGILFWVAAVASALLPVIAEARMAGNHNETLVRDDV
jgi:hypothetical protein